MPEKSGKDEDHTCIKEIRSKSEEENAWENWQSSVGDQISDMDTPRPIPPKVVITQPSSADLLPSLTASIDTLPSGDKKKCCVIL